MSILNELGRLVLFLENKGNEAVYDGYRKRYIINRDFKFSGNNIRFYGNYFNIGYGYMGRNCILSSDEGRIYIGNNCRIGHNVTMSTFNRVADQDLSHHPDEDAAICGTIRIGKNCCIGNNVFIKHGVTIGNNCFIGANAVVTKSFPDYSVIAGVPAKKIGRTKHGV